MDNDLDDNKAPPPLPPQILYSGGVRMCGTMGTDLHQLSRGFSHVKIFKQDHSWGMGKLVPNPDKLGTNDCSL
jgi:hypothetical protein